MSNVPAGYSQSLPTAANAQQSYGAQPVTTAQPSYGAQPATTAQVYASRLAGSAPSYGMQATPAASGAAGVSGGGASFDAQTAIPDFVKQFLPYGMVKGSAPGVVFNPDRWFDGTSWGAQQPAYAPPATPYTPSGAAVPGRDTMATMNGMTQAECAAMCGYDALRCSTKGSKVVNRAKVSGSTAMSGSVHVVRRGDTLSNIAARHGVTWQQVYSYNRATVANPNLIYPGQRLRIPPAGYVATHVAVTTSHAHVGATHVRSTVRTVVTQARAKAHAAAARAKQPRAKVHAAPASPKQHVATPVKPTSPKQAEPAKGKGDVDKDDTTTPPPGQTPPTTPPSTTPPATTPPAPPAANGPPATPPPSNTNLPSPPPPVWQQHPGDLPPALPAGF